MHYIVCEGEENKSEYKFISAVLNQIADKPYKLVSANGNRNIKNTFSSINFYEGDTFILIFDCVETIDNIPVVSILRDLLIMCSRKKVYFRYSTWYCFEELFLSYSGLLDLVKDSSVKYNLELLQNNILSGVNYFESDLSFWKYYITDSVGSFKNRVKLSSAICNKILHNVIGDFKLTKSSIGSCWISSCRDSSLSSFICNKCNFCCKDCSFELKLNSLHNNSISKFSLPLTDLLN